MILCPVSGSEAVFKHACQPCSSKHVLDAVGFCVDCQEWLCRNCYKHHRLPTPCRNHELMSLDQVKANKPTARGRDKCTHRCDKHGDKRIKYFCAGHDSVGCSLCIIHYHKGCTVENVADLNIDVFKAAEFKTLVKRYENVAKTAQQTQDDVEKAKTQSASNHARAAEAIKTYRKELDEILDKREKELLEECENHPKDEMRSLDMINNRVKAAEAQSRALVDQMDGLRDGDRTCDDFVIMKQGAKKIGVLENGVKEARYSAKVKDYDFIPNRCLNALKSPNGMGMLTSGDVYDKTVYKNMTAEFVADIPVQDSNKQTCRITGSVLLSPTRLVLVDHINQQIKLIDVDTVIASMKVNAPPGQLP